MQKGSKKIAPTVLNNYPDHFSFSAWVDNRTVIFSLEWRVWAKSWILKYFHKAASGNWRPVSKRVWNSDPQLRRDNLNDDETKRLMSDIIGNYKTNYLALKKHPEGSNPSRVQNDYA